jgi:hypothetical protein
MRAILFLSGFLFLSPSAHALSAPPLPTTLSSYAQEVLSQASRFLSSTTGGGGGGSCDSHREVTQLRILFMQTQAGFGAPSKDIARSVCFVGDIQLMELYLAGLIDKAAEAASSCDTLSARAYRSAAEVVWDGLTALRMYGLDPTAYVPVSGTGNLATIPPGAIPSTDDARCAYHSGYAETSFAHVGCQYGLVLSSASPILAEESTLLRRILFRMQGDGFLGLDVELPLLRGILMNMLEHADAFVSGMTVIKPVRPIVRYSPTFVPRVIQNAGESGCKGWPSDVAGGPVTGENVPLQQYFPYVLTDQLAEAFAFLEERSKPEYLEYLRSTDEASSAERERLHLTPGLDIAATNREHIESESALIFSLRQPQLHNETLANRLHKSVREFAGQASLFPGSPFDPPLRDFVRRYVTFLSRMCVNRGCDSRLLRTLELSMRNECFSSFISDHFFSTNPTESSLPACRALYVP